MEQTHLYSSHHNVNLLTAALLAHNICHIVVCPGSRNAPIVHNLQVNGGFSLYSVTDERSAAFVALGLWLKVRTGVALCVTSGSALLNTLPGVAEAALRNIPLVIISADRPQEFHGILDGQTLPQQGALQPYVRSWQVEECTIDQEEECRETLREAFRSYGTTTPQAIHLNVPIAEPLFTFNVEKLPTYTIAVSEMEKKTSSKLLESWKTILSKAELPALVLGQVDDIELHSVVNRLKEQHQLLVYAECLSQCHDHRTALWIDAHEDVVPDVVIHCGGCFVNKQFKQRLRKLLTFPYFDLMPPMAARRQKPAPPNVRTPFSSNLIGYAHPIHGKCSRNWQIAYLKMSKYVKFIRNSPCEQHFLLIAKPYLSAIVAQ